MDGALLTSAWLPGRVGLAERGLEALTIRALPERLGVMPNVLYSHVANKTALIDDLLDEVLAEVTAPGPDVRDPGADLQPEHALRRGHEHQSLRLLAGCLQRRGVEASLPGRQREAAGPGHRHPAALTT